MGGQPQGSTTNPFTGQAQATSEQRTGYTHNGQPYQYTHKMSPQEIAASQMTSGFERQGKLNDELGQASKMAARSMKTDFGGFNANLNSNFSQYDPRQTGGLDAQSQRLLSQQDQASRNQLATQQNSIAQQFGSSPTAGVLQAQAASRGMLQGNTNQLNVAQQQAGRNMAEQSFLSQQQQLGNQTQLSQQGFNAGLQQAGNSALTQRLGVQSVPATLGQDLLSRMSEYAKQGGGK